MEHPLRGWYARTGRTVGEGRAYLSATLPSRPTVGSMKQLDSCHYRPSWDLCFEIEAETGIPARTIRDVEIITYPKEDATKDDAA